MIIYLAGMTLLEHKDIIVKHSRQKVANTQYLLCGGITRHISTTCPSMKFIYRFPFLCMSEAPLKNCIDIMMIKGVSYYNIVFSLVSDILLVRARGIGLES